MKQLQALQGVDIYLLDQALKGRLHENSRVLDAGCGSGRNFSWLASSGFNVSAFDPKEASIAALRTRFPDYSKQLTVCTIEQFESTSTFDFIICNAVLHFTANHDTFYSQMEKLTSLLSDDGILFIRMASDFGMEELKVNEMGWCNLPDGSSRYLLTRRALELVLSRYKIQLIEPIKSVLVDQQRSMTTLVLKK